MNILKQVKKFLKNDSGNVAMIFGIALIPLMLSVGAAVDYSRASSLQSKVAHATDAALLAAVASVIDDVDLEDTAAINSRLKREFEPFFLANMNDYPYYKYGGYSISFDPKTKAVDVDVDFDYKTAVFGVVGVNSWQSDVNAAAKLEVNSGGAISMYLVLDRSGSMRSKTGGGVTKLKSLQIAVSSMIENFKESDSGEEYIRMGAVAYNSKKWPSTSLGWKLDNVDNYVGAMRAGGGTNSSAAVNDAYNSLKDANEISEHKARNGQKPELIMVFMTDGNNSSSSYDNSTKTTCDKAKAIDIEIYTVAFQAPKNGRTLLAHCATSPDHYFEPENTDELIKSFERIGKNASEKLVLTK